MGFEGGHDSSKASAPAPRRHTEPPQPIANDAASEKDSTQPLPSPRGKADSQSSVRASQPQARSPRSPTVPSAPTSPQGALRCALPLRKNSPPTPGLSTSHGAGRPIFS